MKDIKKVIIKAEGKSNTNTFKKNSYISLGLLCPLQAFL